MTPRISIITPSYNQGKYIERTIQSVLAQEVEGLEYVVIDGGSTDQTVEILQGHGNRFSWVSEKDRGHADAINKGLARSSAPIVGWLNSDDIYYPDALATVLEFFAAHPDVDVVYGDANHIDEKDAFIEKYVTEPWNWDRLLENCYISQPATFFRRAVVDCCGLIDEQAAPSIDYEYWVRLGKSGVRFEYLPKLLAATRLHDEALTVGSRIACHVATNNFMRAHFGRTPERWIFNYAHAVVETKGFRRSEPFQFAVAVSLVSWYASLRWNHSLSRNILQTTGAWITGNAGKAIRENLA
jgi:glycosyltransferase involved in cell wall biosynthesis